MILPGHWTIIQCAGNINWYYPHIKILQCAGNINWYCPHIEIIQCAGNINWYYPHIEALFKVRVISIDIIPEYENFLKDM